MKKFYYLELLRFFTALSVLIMHYQHFFKPHSSLSTLDYEKSKTLQPFYSNLEVFYNFGHLGVQMFWAISGFVFAFVYLEQEKKISINKFFVNRLARLYPLHFATLIAVLLLQIVSLKLAGEFQIYKFNDLYHFFLQIFFISGWGFENGYSFNAPIWSVSIEILVYILFFFSITYLNKYNVKYVLLIYIFLLFIDKFNLITNVKFASFLLIDCAKLFFSGVLVFYIYNFFNKKIYLLFISILLIFLSFLGNFKLFLFFPSLLLFFLSLELFILNSFKKPFQILGNLTYAIYLLHIPIQISFILIFNQFNIFNEVFFNNYFFIFYIFFMMSLSYICFRFYEKPLNNKIRSFFLR